MIKEITIRGFKSLVDVHLKLGHLNLFLGTNASGKSNFFDALRVLQGVGYGFTIDEILNGKPKSASGESWDGIRGGSAKAAFLGTRENDEDAKDGLVEFVILMETTSPVRTMKYSLAFSAWHEQVREECLIVDDVEIYNSSGAKNTSRGNGLSVKCLTDEGWQSPELELDRARPVLSQLPGAPVSGKARLEAVECIKSLRNMQCIDPSPILLRAYSASKRVDRMGDRGENFAALVNTILHDPKTKDPYVSWLKQLTPTEFDKVKILNGALGEPLFALMENGEDYPAPILSDGTLRFAAICAAFFQPDMPEILTIEEIENGIHPSRVRLLLELLKSQSSLGGTQVMATTHSPTLLAWLREADYETTFFCKRDEDSSAATIRPLSQIPDFAEITKRQPIGDLFAEGWLESAL